MSGGRYVSGNRVQCEVELLEGGLFASLDG
jgi:hypothetical protein